MARLSNRLWVGFFWAAALVVLVAPASQLSFNNDDWLPASHPQEIYLDYLAEQFAPGDGLVIALDVPQGFFRKDVMARIERLEAALDAGLGKDLISRRSPLSAMRLDDNRGVIEVESFSDALARGAFKDLKAYERAFAQSPYAGRLLSDDHRLAALDLRLDTREQAARRAGVIEIVRAVLAQEGWQGRYHLIAQAALKDAINSQTRADLPLLLAGAAMMLAVFLWLALGRWMSAAFVFLTAAAAVLGSLSIIVLLGHDMTAVALVLPVLAGVIAVAHGLHILAHHRDLSRKFSDGEPNDFALAQKTIRRVWWPCFLANLTTAIGLGSFAVSELFPLRNFGWDSLITMVMLYLLVLAAFWSLFCFFGPQIGLSSQSLASNFLSRLLARFLAFCHRATSAYPAGICLAVLLLTSFLGAGLVRFHTETNFLEVFFKPASQIRQDFALADQKLGGAGAVDVIIRHEAPDHFKTLQAFDHARQLAARLASHGQVNHAEAMDIPVGQAHQAFTGKKALPDTDNKLAQELLFLELSRSESKDDILSPYANFDYTATRIHLRTPDLGSGAIARLIVDVETIIGIKAVEAAQSAEVFLTGFNIFVHALGEEILSTQIASLALSGILVFVIFLLQFGWRIGVLGFLSNLVPVVAVLGVISWSGTPFDFTTILVASITLGLAVDDSIHFLHSWRRARREGMSALAARRTALDLTGWAIILTSLLFCAGAAVFLLSELVLLIKFAIFMMIGLALDLFSSVLFLPALLAFAARDDID